jgi:hypothetical protein
MDLRDYFGGNGTDNTDQQQQQGQSPHQLRNAHRWKPYSTNRGYITTRSITMREVALQVWSAVAARLPKECFGYHDE